MAMHKLNNGCSIPLLGLGTYKIVGQDVVTETLDAALDAGYRLIDTAGCYRNEVDIGATLEGLLNKYGLQRSDVFITSKLAPRHHGTARCREACLQSLNSLKIDCLDMYLIHWPGMQGLKPNDARHPELRKQSWRDLEQLFVEGRLKGIGVSNYTVRHLEELLQYCHVKPAVLQVEFHPHLVQKDLLEFCHHHDIFVQAYSSLGTSASNNKLLTSPEVARIAAECQRTSAQVLLRWAIQQGIAVVPKSTNAEHIRGNAKIFEFELSADQMSVLNGLDCGIHYAWDPTGVL
jgi:diketogulonate reductase-like aldo/keto reductase